MEGWRTIITAADRLTKIIENTLSLELRIPDAEVETMIATLDALGFKSKNSWASVQLPGHTVVEFWKKELMKA
ncbi:hypothetical protein I8J29_31875 [Paenibacillus sp. MWE-103]|uniref:Uncharacterized protein n=1 Tax=Paenibacillus artemisiicola TaxID=1172618 RepID=A0ABS3WKD3_9BACL|nr:hypothetical protein [Paenibacillus artemisiicola]MBO7748779.1 hypothetical protein [Paenibacillus artemisiicola]